MYDRTRIAITPAAGPVDATKHCIASIRQHRRCCTTWVSPSTRRPTAADNADRCWAPSKGYNPHGRSRDDAWGFFGSRFCAFGLSQCRVLLDVCANVRPTALTSAENRPHHLVRLALSSHCSALDRRHDLRSGQRCRLPRRQPAARRPRCGRHLDCQPGHAGHRGSWSHSGTAATTDAVTPVQASRCQSSCLTLRR